MSSLNFIQIWFHDPTLSLYRCKKEFSASSRANISLFWASIYFFKAILFHTLIVESQNLILCGVNTMEGSTEYSFDCGGFDSGSNEVQFQEEPPLHVPIIDLMGYLWSTSVSFASYLPYSFILDNASKPCKCWTVKDSQVDNDKSRPSSKSQF